MWKGCRCRGTSDKQCCLHRQGDSNEDVAGMRPWAPAVSQQVSSPVSQPPPRSAPVGVPSPPSSGRSGFEAAGWDPSPAPGTLERAEAAGPGGHAGPSPRFIVGSAPQMGAARRRPTAVQSSPALQGLSKGAPNPARLSIAASQPDDFHTTVQEVMRLLDLNAGKSPQNTAYRDAAREIFGDGTGRSLPEDSTDMGPLVGAIVNRWQRSLRTQGTA